MPAGSQSEKRIRRSRAKRAAHRAHVLQQFARDDQLLHFGRTFVDAQRADLAVQPLDRLLR